MSESGGTPCKMWAARAVPRSVQCAKAMASEDAPCDCRARTWLRPVAVLHAVCLRVCMFAARSRFKQTYRDWLGMGAQARKPRTAALTPRSASQKKPGPPLRCIRLLTQYYMPASRPKDRPGGRGKGQGGRAPPHDIRSAAARAACSPASSSPAAASPCQWPASGVRWWHRAGSRRPGTCCRRRPLRPRGCRRPRASTCGQHERRQRVI